MIKKAFYNIFIIYKKISEYNSVEETYYKKNKYVILNRAKYFHKNDKEILRKQARDKYRNLSEEQKDEKGKNGRKRYHNMSEEKNKD